MLRALLVSSVLALAAGCSTTTPWGAGEGFRTLSRGYQTGLHEEGTLVARTPEEWAELWRRHTSIQVPRPPSPEVDFSREMVVCALLGERPSLGWGIEVEAARWDGQRIVLAARETKPAEDAVVPTVVTRPFHMIATARASGSVRIEWQ
jgi:hypothetical protein